MHVLPLYRLRSLTPVHPSISSVVVRSPSPSPTRTPIAASAEHVHRLCRPRQSSAARPGPAVDHRWSSRITARTPTRVPPCTPTPTPTVTPEQTPTHTSAGKPTPSNEIIAWDDHVRSCPAAGATAVEADSRSRVSSESFSPVGSDDLVAAVDSKSSRKGPAETAQPLPARRGRAANGISALPPVPAFPSRFSSSSPTRVATSRSSVRAAAAAAAQRTKLCVSEGRADLFAEPARLLGLSGIEERVDNVGVWPWLPEAEQWRDSINLAVQGRVEAVQAARGRDDSSKKEERRSLPSIDAEVCVRSSYFLKASVCVCRCEGNLLF